MTLRRQFLLQNLLLTTGLLAAGLISVWRLGLLQRDLVPPHNVYSEMRRLGDVATEVGTVRGLLAEADANRDPIVTRLGYAIGGLEQFIQVGKGYDGPGSDQQIIAAYVPINRTADLARSRLSQVLLLFQNDARPIKREEAAVARKALDDAADDLGRVNTSCLQFLSQRQQSASDRATRVFLLIGGLSLAGVGAAVTLSILQDRRVLQPLQRLRQGVGRVAAAQFAEQIPLAEMTSSPEFLELATEFNQMATELDGFYQRLEEQVRSKSRELVRSERLASVGFLAAGVAHEINNPLNIISGYAELTAKQIAPGKPALDESAVIEARDSLQVIRSEAFRCKEITEKLLSLVRGGDDVRQVMDLSTVATDVALMIKGLRNFRDRRVIVSVDPQSALEVEANPAEMKQVLLNLTVNALQAVPPGRGEVHIEAGKSQEWIELKVRDNGQGMEPDVLQHVFEPFFTRRHAAGADEAGGGEPARDRGIGLGLSITHAIVENHGGRIRAESPGPGRGSCFTIQLPRRRAGTQN